MTEERGPRWRSWAAAGLLVTVPVLAFVAFRPAEEAPAPAPAANQTPQPAPRPATPRPQPALGRAELIEAAARAASAFVAGAPAPAENIALAGRRFVLRLPFGCGGPTPQGEDAPVGWSYDAESETLRAQVTPQSWAGTPLIQSVAGNQAYEAVEGFWINRPWVRTEACPITFPPTGEDTAKPARQTLAIARFFEPGLNRAARRDGQPYSVSTKVEPEDVPGNQGLRLVIEGRLSADPSRQPFGCWADSPDQRPICVIRARFDRVAITGATGENAWAEWTD